MPKDPDGSPRGDSAMIADRARGAQFHDRLAGSWNDNYSKGGFRKRLAFVRRLMGSLVLPGEVWLDAGCGGGILTVELSTLGARGLAVDGSPGMIDAAIRDAGPVTDGFTFKTVASISAIQVEDATFDGVLCSSVVEYVENVDETFGEISRVLRPGGKLVLSVPNRSSLVRRAQKLIRFAGRSVGLDPFPYLGVSANDFARNDLIRRLGEHGFAVRAVEGFDPLVPAPFNKVVPSALYFAVAEKISSHSLLIEGES